MTLVSACIKAKALAATANEFQRVSRILPQLEHTVASAIERAIAFLCESQLPSGEFKALLGSDERLSNAVFDSGPFATCFVIYSLGHVEHPKVRGMKDAALDFIEREKEFGGVWRYYGRTQFKHCRVPPDLDDTACASYALKSNGRQFRSNRWIFRATRDDRSRFLTWILPKPNSHPLSPLRIARGVGAMQARWALRFVDRPDQVSDARLLRTSTDPVPPDDVDPVVNANVILYLGEHEDTRAAIAWLVDAVRDPQESLSLYYKDPLALCYMVSRAYRHAAPSLVQARESILARVAGFARPDGAFGTPLSTALAACTLLTFEPESALLPPAIAALLKSQRSDGSWEASPIYSGPHEYWGSAEITTAFCLEALARYRTSVSIGQFDRAPETPSVATRQRRNGYRSGVTAGEISSFFVRWDEWWFHKVPFCILIFALALREPLDWGTLAQLAVLVVTVSAVANFGHAINEIFDQKEDEKVQKPNLATDFGTARMGVAAVSSAVLAMLLSWFFAGPSGASVTAFALTLPPLYSVPPVRLKERGWLGLLADAFAAHVYPAVLAIIFANAGSIWRAGSTFIGLVVLWSLLAGLRNIALHQLFTEHRDRQAGLKTVVHDYGLERVTRFTVLWLLPFELLALSAVIALSAPDMIFVSITALYIVKEIGQCLLGDKRVSADPAQLVFFPFIDNAYYLVWAPLAALASLTLRYPLGAFLIIGFMLLFWQHLAEGWSFLKGIWLSRASQADTQYLLREVEDRDRRLMIADADLRRLMAEVEEHERKLVAADADLRRLLTEVAERDRKLVEADADLRRLVIEVEERERKLVAADADLRRLVIEVEERERRLVAADADLRRLMGELERQRGLKEVASSETGVKQE
ncbi:hypothetical protein [Bradyrhizobium sp.]